MTTENIDIRIREDGSRVVKRNIQDIGETAQKSASGVDLLKRALGAIAAFLAVDQVRRYADAWASANGQIRVATRSTEEAAAVTDRLFKVAQNTRQGFTDIVELYGRTARAGKELGVSQAQLIKFTENVGKTLAASATDATKAQGALMQMGQALGSGVVRAEEFNSILEGAPAILQVVANNIGGAEGSIGKLRKMMLDGKLTSRAFFDAFMQGSEQIDRDFGKSAFTISQGLTLIGNAFTKWIGETDQSLGVSQKFGQAAKWVADNMGLVAAGLLAVGAAAAVAFAPAALTAFAGALRGLWAVVAANPFLALAAAVAAAVALLTAFRDQIKIGVDDTTTLGDVFRALGEQATAGFGYVREAAGNAFSGLAAIAQGAYQAVTQSTGEATAAWAQQYTDFYAGVGTGFAGVVKAVVRTIDAIAGLLTGLGMAVIRTLGGVPGAIGEMFNRTYNAAAEFIESTVNTVIDGVNRMRKAVGLDLLETVKFDRKAVDTKFFENYGESIARSIDDGFAQQGGFLEKWVDGVFGRAKEISKQRAALLGGQTGVDLNQALGKPTQGGIDEKELEKQRKARKQLQDDLSSLLNTIAPVEGAKIQLAKAESLLSAAVSKGLISTEQQTRYLALLQAHYTDLVDPVGRVNRELDEQGRLLGLSAQARQTETQLLSVEKELRAQGITLTESETAAMRAKLEALQRLNEQVAVQDQLLAASVQQRLAFTTQLQAIQTLLNDPNSGFTGADATGALMGRFGQDMFAGTQEAIAAQVAQFQEMYAQIDQMRQRDLISEQTAQQLRAKVAVQQNQTRLQDTQSFFGNLATLSRSGNKRIAAIGRAAAVTQATIDGVLAVQKALASAPPPVNYALAAAVGAAAAANVAQIAGFKEGGFTGNGGTSEVAGVVHGREFVVNAEATQRNRAALEAMNAGRDVSRGGGTTVVGVVVNNNAPGTRATAKERETPSGREIEITIEQVVTRQIRGGGGIASAMESQYGLNRAVGTVR